MGLSPDAAQGGTGQGEGSTWPRSWALGPWSWSCPSCGLQAPVPTRAERSRPGTLSQVGAWVHVSSEQGLAESKGHSRAYLLTSGPLDQVEMWVVGSGSCEPGGTTGDLPAASLGEPGRHGEGVGARCRAGRDHRGPPSCFSGGTGQARGRCGGRVSGWDASPSTASGPPCVAPASPRLMPICPPLLGPPGTRLPRGSEVGVPLGQPGRQLLRSRPVR